MKLAGRGEPTANMSDLRSMRRTTESGPEATPFTVVTLPVTLATGFLLSSSSYLKKALYFVPFVGGKGSL